MHGGRAVDHYHRRKTADSHAEQLRGRVQGAVRIAKACCFLDTDGDGNCSIHSAPGVLRRPR
jgi:hypothetical protein